MKWKLYYDDHTTYSSDDGDWLEAPAWGVVAVAAIDTHRGRTIERARDIACGDYYLWRVDATFPWSADCGGLLDLLIHAGVMTEDQSLSDIPASAMIAVGVKFGRGVDNDAWPHHSEWIVADADATFGFGTGHRSPLPELTGNG